jgi:uncharacterized protein (DUF849 family)
VQIHDDEQLEVYLKRFHPIAPEPVLRIGHSSRRSLPLLSSLAAVAAVLVAGAAILHVHSRVVVPNTARNVASAERHAPSEPLTMRSANAWLATAPSFKSAVDGLAFRPESSPLPQGKQSAVAVLSKEKIRL